MNIINNFHDNTNNLIYSLYDIDYNEVVEQGN